MKNLTWLLPIVAVAAVYLLVSKAPRPSAAATDVEDLTHKLQDAWADHHTKV